MIAHVQYILFENQAPFNDMYAYKHYIVKCHAHHEISQPALSPSSTTLYDIAISDNGLVRYPRVK